MAPDKKPVRVRNGKSRSTSTEGPAKKSSAKEKKLSCKEKRSTKSTRKTGKTGATESRRDNRSCRVPRRSDRTAKESKEAEKKKDEKKDGKAGKTVVPEPAKKQPRKKASSDDKHKSPAVSPKVEEEDNENSGESQLIKFDLKEEPKEKTAAPTPPKDPKVDYNKLKETVQKFLDNLKTKTWKAVQKEFEFGYRKEPKDKVKDSNADTRFKITTNVPPETDFYDASKVEIPGIENKFILAAEPGPDKKCHEDFWRMVYDSNVTNIFYLENYDDEAKTAFIPWKVGEGQDFGKMFISNKKIDSSTRFAVQTVLEVLPEGCSNSLIVRFMQCRKWPETLVSSESESMHALCFFRLLKDDKGATLIICKNGLGRSAMFLMAHSICTLFNNNTVVEIPDILAKIRTARWGAIQEEEQYLTLHMIVFKYIQQKFRKHLADECDKQKIALAEHLEKIG